MTIENLALRTQCANAIRALAMDAVQAANSGHPGMPMGMADIAEALFRDYGEAGVGQSRKYLHDATEAAPYKQEPGTFTPWETLPDSELLFYEGLHGGVTTEKVDIARHVDLLIGVVPVINLEWIQKLSLIHI